MTLKQALINSQEVTPEEADRMISEMKERVWNGENPEEILFDEGLEPDYVMDLLDM